MFGQRCFALGHEIQHRCPRLLLVPCPTTYHPQRIARHHLHSTPTASPARISPGSNPSTACNREKTQGPSTRRPKRLYYPAPHVSTLDLHRVIEKNSFIRFAPVNPTNIGESIRLVVCDTQNPSPARINVPTKHYEPGKLYWLHPYINPTTKSLKLLRKDEAEKVFDDYPGFEYNVHQMAARLNYRPLLELAFREGFIDLVPPRELPGLDKEETARLGYGAYASVSTGGIYYSRIKLPGRAVENISFRTKPERSQACVFPYIDRMGLKLRFWDLVTERDVVPLKRSDGYDASEVRSRWPSLYLFAQEKGYWLDEPRRNSSRNGRTAHKGKHKTSGRASK